MRIELWLPVMPRILHMPKLKEQLPDKEKVAPIQRPVLPDADEEHASVAKINKWIALGDVALEGRTYMRAA